jgi:hypothetical protein
MKTAMLTRSFSKRSFTILIAMLALVALTLPSFAEEGEPAPTDEGTEELYKNHGQQRSAEVHALKGLLDDDDDADDDDDDDDADDAEELEDEELEDEEGDGSARSIEVHMLKDAGCSPSRGIGLKLGHAKNGKYEACDMSEFPEPLEDAWKNPGKGREKSKAKHGSDDS